MLGFRLFYTKDKDSLPEGFVKGNGRIEATEVDIATSLPGRLDDVRAHEGDAVRKDQVLANMDSRTLRAMLKQAEAEVRRAMEVRRAALALVEESKNRVVLADKELVRSSTLYTQGIATRQQLDRDQTYKLAYDAQYSGLQAKVAEAEAAIESAKAQTERLKSEIDECILRASCDGAVKSRLAEPGEVLPAGGKVLTVIARDDMYMNIFLPERVAGKVAIGSEARIVLDAIPDRVFPARVIFVAEKAQFTPKEVEAAEERQKLVFRIKVEIQGEGDARLKPGMPGTAIIRLDDSLPWPEQLP